MQISGDFIRPFSLELGCTKATIISAFEQEKIFTLPVVAKGNLVGNLDLFVVLRKDAKVLTESIINTDIESAVWGEEIDLPAVGQQEILPVVDVNGRYLGFLKTKECECILKNKKYAELQKRFKEVEEEYNAIFNNSYDGIYITDGKAKTLKINKACERIEGIKTENVIGRYMHELVADDYYSESVTLRVLKSGKPETIMQRTKNGNEVIATGNPVYQNGKITRVITNSRDIGELNKMKQELNKMKELKKRYDQELIYLRQTQTSVSGKIFKNHKMKKLLQTALHVAGVDTTVLLQGESGVGKGILAKIIHNNSARNEGPFITIDCAAIPPTLLESELFGYEKGAFTGANQKGKIGLIELAHKGTLFFDEIGEIPLNLQSKILQIIQEHKIRRIGGSEQIDVDVRIVAATNQDLYTMVEQKIFREDLYYRINVVPIRIPPLRERKDEIIPLINHFLALYCSPPGEVS